MQEEDRTRYTAGTMIQVLYKVRRRALALLRWRTRGVKVAAFDAGGRVLLVRHGYGRSDLWMLPGGGLHRRERAEAGAVRELAEETGCGLAGAAVLARVEARAEGRRDTVWLVRGRTDDAPQPDGREVIEACFFSPDAPPPEASPATRRRLAELAAGRVAGGAW